METSKKWKISGLALGVLLLCALGALGYAIYDDYSYRRVLDLMSQDAGRADAMVGFYQGYLRIYETDKSRRDGGFSGRREGPFEVWFDSYRAEDPEPWKFSRRIFWEEYNKMMHYMEQHPDRFRAGSSAVTNHLSKRIQ